MGATRQAVGEAGQRKLLELARMAILAAVGGGDPHRVDDGGLDEDLLAPRAAFVTLTENGELRGCIGRLDPETPLWRNTVNAAVSAAVGDPRFQPVGADELDSLRLEISVLDAAHEIHDPEQFDPAIHGIMVERGMARGILLPKVAQEYGWDRRETLAAVCWKAGLPLDAWLDPETRLSVFTAFVFRDDSS